MHLPNSRSVFRAGVSLNIHSFMHVCIHIYQITRNKLESTQNPARLLTKQNRPVKVFHQRIEEIS